MLRGIGYKNERILMIVFNVILVSVVVLALYLVSGYPHFFPYYQELEEARVLILPEAYIEKMAEVEEKFNLVLMECGFMYWVYESSCLVLFGQTLGQRIFRKKLVMNWETRYPGLVKLFVMPTRTLVKVLCVIWVIPMLIIGGMFLLGRKEKTLLDRIFFTVLQDG